MENQPPSKRFKPCNTSDLKLSIVDKFKSIINQIDIDAESLLLDLNGETSTSRVNEQRNKMITEIENTIKSNLDYLDKNSIKDVFQLSKHDLFVKCCLYLDTNILNDYSYVKDRLGILIVSDYFMSHAQFEIFKYYFSFT